MKKEIEYYLRGTDMPERELKEPSMKYCTKCEFVWDYWHQSGHYYFNKYPDMPTYKLTREECRECAGKELSRGRDYRRDNQKS